MSKVSPDRMTREKSGENMKAFVRSEDRAILVRFACICIRNVARGSSGFSNREGCLLSWPMASTVNQG
jgi:hypothetical protein